MNHDSITGHEDIQASDAIKLMLEEHIDCLPVLNKHNVVVGIITSSDLIKWMLEFFKFIE